MEENVDQEVEAVEMTEEDAREILRKLSIPEDVSEDMISKWKTEFSHCEIYAMRFSEKEAFIWRTLTRFEYKQLLKSIGEANFTDEQELQMYNEEAIVERCLLFPKINRVDMGSMKAGTITVLSDAIMGASGFSPMGGPVRL